MAGGDLTRKTEKAFVTWLADSATHSQTIGITARQFSEDDTDTNALPKLTVKAARGNELHSSPPTGVFEYEVELELKANADDTTEAVFEGYVEKIETILQWDDLVARLSDAVASFKVFGISQLGPGALEIDGRSWTWTYGVTLWAQAGD